LDVVYNPAAFEWLVDFFTRPHQTPDAQLRRAARRRYEVMKQKTKQEFMRNWGQILEGKLVILFSFCYVIYRYKWFINRKSSFSQERIPEISLYCDILDFPW
jgi:hypothetical protein